MRQGPNGRRPRGRHHGGHGGGGHSGHSGGGNGNGNGNGNMSNPMNNSNRPRSAASLRHQTFDSHCLDIRVRGNAWQVYEKYQAIARDAQSAGDRVSAENYLQHAEHYYRIIEAINEATAIEQRQRPGQPPSPFGEQPTTPPNYFGPDGNGVMPPGAPPADGAAQGQAPAAPQQQQATAAAPGTQPPSAFFTPDEAEEANRDEALVARR